MKYSEKWGDSVEGAVNLALQDLGLTLDQVTVTVLEEPSRGFFGLGSKLAKVRVEEKQVIKEKVKRDAPVKKEKQEIKPKEHKEHKENKAAKEHKEVKDNREIKEKKSVKPAKTKKKDLQAKKTPADTDELKEEIKISNSIVSERPENLVAAPEHPAQKFLTDLIREMKLDAAVSTYIGDKLVYIEIEGSDSGTIIGKRGATLDAIQYLTSLVVNKDETEYVRVVINAEGYREKREKTLEILANKLADKVVKTGKTARLEPMNPYERKVIHTTLQSRTDIRTRSEGEEPYRKVVIELAKK